MVRVCLVDEEGSSEHHTVRLQCLHNDFPFVSRGQRCCPLLAFLLRGWLTEGARRGRQSESVARQRHSGENLESHTPRCKVGQPSHLALYSTRQRYLPSKANGPAACLRPGNHSMDRLRSWILQIPEVTHMSASVGMRILARALSVETASASADGGFWTSSFCIGPTGISYRPHTSSFSHREYSRRYAMLFFWL